MSQILSSAAVVIGVLRVNLHHSSCEHALLIRVENCVDSDQMTPTESSQWSVHENTHNS